MGHKINILLYRYKIVGINHYGHGGDTISGLPLLNYAYEG
jgi:hypothetical protein